MHQDAWCLLHWKFFAHLCSIERCFSLCCLQVASAWLEDLEVGRLRTSCAWHPKVETADRHSLPGGWCSEDCWGQKRTEHLRCVPKFVFYTRTTAQRISLLMQPPDDGPKKRRSGRSRCEREKLIRWSYADFGTQEINRFLHFLNDCFAQASDLAAFFEAWPCQSHEFLDLFGFGLVALVALLWGILACTRGRAEKPWRSIKSCLLLSFNFFFYSECS